LLFSFGAAAAAAAGAVPGGAGAAVGTADTLFAAFFGLIYVPAGGAHDYRNGSDDDNIYTSHKLTSFR